MIRIRRLGGMGLGVGLLALVAACGGETRPAAAPTETTAAQMPYDEQIQHDIAQMKFERDTTQRLLGDQIERNDEQARRLMIESKEKEERVALARSASSAIETAQTQLRAHEKKLAKATGNQRVKMDKALSGLKEKLANVELKASKIALDHGPDWAAFRSDLQVQISDLHSEVEAASAK